MKFQIIAVAALSAFALAAQDTRAGDGTVKTVTAPPVGQTTTTTTTVTTTTLPDRSVRETKVIEKTVTPAEGDYTYVEYDGEIVPYYRGYYYIGGVWVWRGPGRPPFPPPKFRPVLRKPVPAKNPAAGKRVPARSVKSSARHGRAAAPKAPPPRR